VSILNLYQSAVLATMGAHVQEFLKEDKGGENESCHTYE